MLSQQSLRNGPRPSEQWQPPPVTLFPWSLVVMNFLTLTCANCFASSKFGFFHKRLKPSSSCSLREVFPLNSDKEVAAHWGLILLT